MDLVAVRAELVDALQEVLPSPWKVLSKPRLLREVWNPPVAVPSRIEVEHYTTMGMGRVFVRILFVVAITGELDDAADADEMVADGPGSPLQMLLDRSSDVWREVRIADRSEIDDTLIADLTPYRGAAWTLELLCPN